MTLDYSLFMLAKQGNNHIILVPNFLWSEDIYANKILKLMILIIPIHPEISEKWTPSSELKNFCL